jgi:LysR family glycine cleavage system transcriptional activator
MGRAAGVSADPGGSDADAGAFAAGEADPRYVPEELSSFELLPHPDWEEWFTKAGCETPRGLRFAPVDYPTHELNANAALAGAGVALLSPSLFRPLLSEGLLIAPFSCVLSGPAWHFALVRSDDPRPAPRHFCAWLCEQAREAECVMLRPFEKPHHFG